MTIEAATLGTAAHTRTNTAVLAKLKSELGAGASHAQLTGGRREGAGIMIVRIATEGPCELPKDQLGGLNELDDAVAKAAQAQSARPGLQRRRANPGLAAPDAAPRHRAER